MLTYISLICITLSSALYIYSGKCRIENRKVVVVIVLLIMFFLSAFRLDVGADYQHFIDEFNSIQKFGVDSSYTELGFSILAFLLGSLGFEAQVIYFVGSALVCFALYFGITKLISSDYWGWAIFLFICLGFFFSSMNISRQYYAISLTTFGIIEYANNNRFRILKFVSWAFFGALFHASALCVLVIPVLDTVIQRYGVRGPIIVAYLISLLFIVVDVRLIIKELLPYLDRWSGYQDSDFFNIRNYSAVAKLIFPNILTIMLLRFYRRDDVRSGNDTVMLSILLCYTMSQNLFYGIMVLTRLSDYFFLGYIWLCIRCSEICNKRNRRNSFWVVVTLYVIVLTVVTIFIKGGNGVLPYRTLLF